MRVFRFTGHVRAMLGEPRCCYEASPSGYILYHSLQGLKVDCAVIAPGSMSRRSDQDVRDAKNLAEYLRLWPPSPERK